jgi:2-phosphosulfolactate phosphatase
MRVDLGAPGTADIRIYSCLGGAANASGTVLVIDVYRAFTCQALAFANGARKVLLTDDPEEALRWKAEGRGDLTMGEVSHGGKYEETGFDFDNSPRNFYHHDVSGMTLIQRTSSGVAGIHAAAPRATDLYAVSFLVAEATVQAVLRRNPERVSLVAMGAWGYRTDEDELCATYLRSRLQGRQPDLEAVRSLVRAGNSYAWYEDYPDDGYPSDAEIGLQFDLCDFAIKVQEEGGILVSRPVDPESGVDIR